MLEEALGFPRTSENWLTTILIGGVLSLLGFLIIPALIINGYLVRVLRAAVNDESQAPEFEDWGTLLIDGILVFVIELVYVGIPTIIFLGGLGTIVGVSALALGSGSGGSAFVGLGIGGVWILAFILIILLASYCLPAAVARFAATGDAAAAFQLRSVFDAAFTVDYFVAILLAIVVSLVLGFIGGLLMIILVGIFILFYLQVVVYYLFGRGYAAGSTETTA